MPDTKLSALTAATTLTSVHIYGEQSGSSKKIPATLFASTDAADLVSGLLPAARLSKFNTLAPAWTDMGASEIDVTKANSKSLTANITLTYSATPATDTQIPMRTTTDATARVITLPAGTHLDESGVTITTFTQPASTTLYWGIVKTAAGYNVLNTSQTAAQAKAALVLVAADLSDFNSASRAQTEAELLAGTGITITPASSGATRTLTIASTGGAIATDTLWDAAGDLAVGTGANTAARLAMGSALQILRVNAGATGLEYVAPGAGSGDVTAAAAFATDNVIVRADGTGKGVQASSVRITDAGDIEVYGDSIPGSLRLADGDATDPEVVTLTAPVDITTSFTLVLPAAAPTAGQQLRQNSANTALEFFTPVPLVGALTCSIPAANAANQTIYADAKAAFGYTINSILGAGTSSGSITLAVKINGTDVTGLAAVAITSTPADTNASAANVVAVGDIVTWVFSSNSSANNLRFTQKITRT